MQYEFPMHDRRRMGRSHRHGWFVEARDNPATVDLAGIAHVDYKSGAWGRWDPGANRHCGEAFFAPGQFADKQGTPVPEARGGGNPFAREIVTLLRVGVQVERRST